VAQDKDGAPSRDSDGQLVREGDPLLGVPDLPGGATYDVAHYVFECLDETAMPETGVCDCDDPMEGP
jgi:hypothetical protein